MADTKLTSESGVISASLEEALIKLNTTVIQEGKPIIIRYYTDTDSKLPNKIDSIFAVGISNGIGPGNYSIISDKGLTVVNNITEVEPDVTEIVYGQVFIYKNLSEGKNYKVYRIGRNRIMELIKLPMIVSCISDRKLYYVTETEVRDLLGTGSDLENCCGLCEDLSKRVSRLEETVEWLLNNNTGGGGEPEQPDIPSEPVVSIISFSVNKDSYFVGEVAPEVKLSWVYSNSDYLGSQSINNNPIDNSLREKTYVDVSSTTTYKLTATSVSGKSTEKTITVNFYPALYSIPSAKITAEEINENPDLLTDLLKTSIPVQASTENIYGVKTFEIIEAGYILYIVPREVELSISYNGFTQEWYTAEVVIGGLDYTVYQSPDPFAPSTQKIKFSNPNE